MKKVLPIVFLFFSHCIFAQTFSNVAAAHNINESFGSSFSFGGGISFCDFDGDGDDDLTFASQAGDSLYFYQNNAGTFQKIPSLVPHDDFSKQVLWVDFDNDGDKDLYVATLSGRNGFYRNDGNLTFTDISTTAGVFPFDPTYGANFVDYDKDGYLDLYITNNEFSTYSNYMYRNNGDGTFTNTTFLSGVGNGFTPDFCSLFFDFNGDGHEDLYTVTDRPTFSNSLYKNNGNGSFTNVSVSSNTDLGIDAMNAGGGDIDNDGDYDLYVTNTIASGGNVMLQNNGDETFTDITDAVTKFDRISWAASFFDYDNDLDLDFYVASFHTDDQLPNGLLVNDGTGNFTEPLFPNGFPGDTVKSLCNTVGDFNDDGLLDIAVSHSGTEKFHLWENQNTGTGNNYLKIRLEGVTANKDGIGSRVEIYINGNKYIRYKHCGEGYLGQLSDKIHFGLGTETSVDSVKVFWVSGNVDKFYNVNANQTFFALENAGGALPVELISFEGKYNQREWIDLNWSSASEENFKGYELQRSENGLQYEKIEFINASNNTALQKNYSYQDENIQSAKRYYYRLKMIDLDGSFVFSNVTSVWVPENELVSVTNFYPNPTSENLTIEIFTKKSQKGVAKIINAFGQVVLEKNIDWEKGENEMLFDVEQIDAGVYFIIFDVDVPTKEIQFVIQRN